MIGQLYEARKHTHGGDRGNQYTKVATAEKRPLANNDGVSKIIADELGRRNLTEEQTTYLRGKLYEARKHVHGGTGANQFNKEQRRQNDATAPGRVREQIMKEQHVGQKTVERSEQYAKGIDAIREVEPELADSILKTDRTDG